MHQEQIDRVTAERDENRVIREPECALLTGVSRCHRWRLERAGDFPKRLRLGEVAHGWLLREVTAWIDERAAARDAA
jgi:prophage regulatory protein